MKTIKKYWAIIAGSVLAVVAIIFATNKLNKNKITKTDKKIDDNNQKIDVIKGKTEVIDEQRNDVKQDIQTTKKDVKKLQDAKQNIKANELPTNAAKQNILNKTRRGRKPKNK